MCIRRWGEQSLTITRGGVIDGNGHKWWGCLRKDDWANASPPCGDDHGVYHSRPHLVMVVRSSDVNMTDLTARDSPNWTLHFAGVKGLGSSGTGFLGVVAFLRL